MEHVRCISRGGIHHQRIVGAFDRGHRTSIVLANQKSYRGSLWSRWRNPRRQYVDEKDSLQSCSEKSVTSSNYQKGLILKILFCSSCILLSIWIYIESHFYHLVIHLLRLFISLKKIFQSGREHYRLSRFTSWIGKHRRDWVIGQLAKKMAVLIFHHVY